MIVIPRQVFGLSSGSGIATGLDALVGISLGIIVPVLSAWRHFRHAFELDVVDHTRSVELWDLESINK